MEHDSGRAAMWVCSALVGLLRHKGIIIDDELAALAASFDRNSDGAEPTAQADMRRAAQWLRHSIPAAND